MNTLEANKLYHTEIIFGKRDDMLLNVYARNVCEIVSEVASRPLLLGIALHRDFRSPEQFKECLNNLKSMISS